jgi:hypothetical protein
MRPEIESALVRRVSLRDIARQFFVSKDAAISRAAGITKSRAALEAEFNQRDSRGRQYKPADAFASDDAFEFFCNLSAHTGLSKQNLGQQFDAMSRLLSGLN